MHKIDLHTHILPESWPDLAERYGCEGWISLERYQWAGRCCARMIRHGRVFREIEENSWSAEARLRECEDVGRVTLETGARLHPVTMQVISTVPVMFSYWAKAAHAHDLSQLLNDHIAGVVRAHPTRFAGLGTLPMQDPSLAVRELERCVGELGLAGIQIGSHIDRGDEPDWNLDDPEVVEVLEAAETLGACVFVHPWDMMGSESMPRYWLPWLVGMPAETARAICSVIFGGVLDRLPRLRIAFAHGGGSFPGTIGRIEHGHRVRPDLCAVHTTIPPSQYLAREDGTPARFYVDSLVHDVHALRTLMRLLTPQRIALGSDYPFPLGEQHPGALIEREILPREPESAEQMLWRTAAEFLGRADLIGSQPVSVGGSAA